MLKVYRVEYYIAIDCGDWHKVEEKHCYPYMLRDDQEPTSQFIPMMTFAEFYEYIQKHPLSGVNYGKHILGKPYIELMYDWSWDSWERYYKFKSILYKRVFKECTSMTLAEIFKNFPADQCIQYLKERGITACPMNL